MNAAEAECLQGLNSNIFSPIPAMGDSSCAQKHFVFMVMEQPRDLSLIPGLQIRTGLSWPVGHLGGTSLCSCDRPRHLGALCLCLNSCQVLDITTAPSPVGPGADDQL